MSNVTAMKFKYYSPVEGRVVRRCGTESFIGATRSPKGFIVDPEAVVAIPEAEVNRYLKDYRNSRVRGDLIERTQADFDAYQERRRTATEQRAQEARGRRAAEQKMAVVEQPTAEVVTPEEPASEPLSTDSTDPVKSKTGKRNRGKGRGSK